MKQLCVFIILFFALNSISNGKASIKEHQILESQNIAFLFINKKSEYPFLKKASIINKDTLNYNENDIIKALAYKSLFQYSKAEEFFLRAEKNLKQLDSCDSTIYYNVLLQMAELYRDMGLYKKSLVYYNVVISYASRHYSENDFYYRKSINGLAILYLYMGYFNKSLPLLIEDLRITEASVGKSHPEYAISLNCLATLYQNLGQYDKALLYVLEDIEITKAVFGNNHFQYAISLNSLASIYSDMGLYEKAIEMCLESIKINTHGHGNKSIEYASSIRTLAEIYHNLGQYEKALHLLHEEAIIIESILGYSHPDYGNNLRKRANVHRDLEQNETALSFYTDALENFKNSLGVMHPNYSKCLNGLAVLLLNMERFEEALPLLIEDLRITEASFGKNHPEYAISLNCLATNYQNLGQYDKALPLLQEDLEITKKVLGENHPDYFTTLICISELLFIMEHFDQADYYFQKASNSLINILKINLSSILDKDKEAFLKKHFNDFEIIYSYYLKRKEDNPFLASIIFNIELAMKGAQLQSSQKLRQSILLSGNDLLIHKFELWLNEKQQMNQIASKPLYYSDINLDSLINNIDLIERELIKESHQLRTFYDAFSFTWESLKSSLKQNEAAVEFISFKYHNGKKWTDSIFYCALVITSDCEYPKLIYLFEENEISGIITDYALYNNHISATYLENRGAKIEWSDSIFNNKFFLYDLIWEPLESIIIGKENIYFSASGLLNRISFASILTPSGNLLMDTYKLIQLSSTRIIPQNKEESVIRNAVLFGGINYDLDVNQNIENDTQVSSTNLLTLRYNSFYDLNSKNHNFKYLKGSLNEVIEISKILNEKIVIDLITGNDAIEESFIKLSGNNSPSIIHIATHGFYFPEITTPNKNSNTNYSFIGKNRFKYSDDPMLRSALIMAGANKSWNGEVLFSSNQDGILTARDVSGLNLNNTVIVVLSACQTGLGDVKGIEGVSGLQSAFKMAGVRYILMSLWSVPDYETVEFMESFYLFWFNGLHVRDAFLATQRKMNEKYPFNPYKWAAFVLIE